MAPGNAEFPRGLARVEPLVEKYRDALELAEMDRTRAPAGDAEMVRVRPCLDRVNRSRCRPRAGTSVRGQ